MDISKTYINMCEKATEIQRHDFDAGDWFSRGLGAEVECGYDTFSGCTWLPRQDQLQKMIDKPYEDTNQEMQAICRHAQLRTMLSVMQEFLKTIDMHTFTSMEQLWLSFVMREKYGKIWNGEDWVKSPS